MEDHTIFIFIIKKSFVKLSTFRLGDFPRVIQVLEKCLLLITYLQQLFFTLTRNGKFIDSFLAKSMDKLTHFFSRLMVTQYSDY